MQKNISLVIIIIIITIGFIGCNSRIENMKDIETSKSTLSITTNEVMKEVTASTATDNIVSTPIVSTYESMLSTKIKSDSINTYISNLQSATAKDIVQTSSPVQTKKPSATDIPSITSSLKLTATATPNISSSTAKATGTSTPILSSSTIKPTVTTTQNNNMVVMDNAFINNVLKGINAERTKAGIPIAKLNSDWSKSCIDHAKDMASKNSVYHSTLSGGWSCESVSKNSMYISAETLGSIHTVHTVSLLTTEYISIGIVQYNNYYWVCIRGGDKI